MKIRHREPRPKRVPVAEWCSIGTYYEDLVEIWRYVMRCRALPELFLVWSVLDTFYVRVGEGPGAHLKTHNLAFTEKTEIHYSYRGG